MAEVILRELPLGDGVPQDTSACDRLLGGANTTTTWCLDIGQSREGAQTSENDQGLPFDLEHAVATLDIKSAFHVCFMVGNEFNPETFGLVVAAQLAP